jgi:hypothetical protein
MKDQIFIWKITIFDKNLDPIVIDKYKQSSEEH